MTAVFESESVRKALESAKPTIASQAVFFAPDVPSEALKCATDSFAQQAKDEQVLAFVLSEKSGKSGFLFTDQALYFRKTLGLPYENCRIPYEEITRVANVGSTFTVIAGRNSIILNLDGTLLWERSRRQVVDVVVILLQAIMSGEHVSVVEFKIDPPATLVDWPEAWAFHAPAMIIGAPLMLVILLFLLNSDMIDYEIGRMFEHIGFGRSLLFCAFSLLPSMYGYGTDLKFSMGRFFYAVFGLTFMCMWMATKAASAGQDVLIVFPVGGGVLGLLLVTGLGNAGLGILRTFRKAPAKQ